MSFDYRQKIPDVDQIIEELPLDANLQQVKAQRDKDIIDVIKGDSEKFIIIIGPCSADNEDAVFEYVSNLSGLQDKVKDKIILIPRIYTNKPRTTGEGYKGMAHQPDPTEAPNVVEGLKAIRKMHIKCLRETGLSAADEMLYPSNYPYLADLLSYVTVGARSIENQKHRLTISGLDVPSGMKNPTSGDLGVMLNSVQAAQMSHIFVYNGWEVKTDGNLFTHCILRGAVNQYGRSIPNYHYEDLMRLAKLYEERELVNRSVIVDTNHANSNKQYSEQTRIAWEVMRSKKSSNILNGIVKGLMIESYLVEGRQDVSGSEYGKSITDPCMSWEDSEKLVLELADFLSKIN